MKRGLFVLLLLLLVSSVFAFETDVSFDGDGEMLVTVILKESSIKTSSSGFATASTEEKKDFLEDKRESVKENQDKVLNKLSEKEKKGKFGIQSNGKENRFHRFSVINGFTGTISRAEFEQLKNDPDVEGIYADKVFHILLNNSTNQINSTLTNTIIQNYSTNLTGTGQTVCVIDTGIDYNHTALGGGWGNRVLGGYDYYNSDTNPIDDNGHGTHVAGIIGSNDSVYHGVAPDVNFVALKVCDSDGDCNSTAMSLAIDWCINNSATYNISVISMSIGSSTTYNSSSCPSDLSTEVNSAIAAGLTFVISSGNSGSKTGISSPACLANSTSVGSVGNDDVITSYSNSVDFLDLLAPGGTSSGTGTCPDANRICSANDGGGFISMSGTSMAAPHVSGAIALLNQYKKLMDNTTYTSTEIENILKTTGDNKTDTNSVITPRINVYAAILSIDNATPSVNYTSTTPANSSITNLDSVIVEINASESVNATLEFNGTNYSMSLISDAIYQKTISSLAKGNYSYLVYYADLAGNSGVLETRIVELNNTAPNITWYSPNVTNVSINETSSQLFNHTSSDTDGNNLSYSWYLNGSLQSNASYWNYSSNCTSTGSYNVTLIVSDGLSNTSQEWNLIVNETNCAPTVSVIYPANTTVLEIGNSTSFTSNSSDPDGDNLTYLWNFGDGNTSASANATNIFMSVANFTVVLTVNDSNTTVNDSIVVEVLDRAAPSFNSSTLSYSSSIYSGSNLSVSANITDYSNITNVTLIFNNTITQNNSPSSNTYSWAILSPVNGSNNFTINATDVYGNFKNLSFNFTVSYCNDGTCDAAESCSSCETDCGACTTSSSPSGGGGGGGSASNSTSLPSRTFAYTTMTSGTSYDLNVNQENIPFTKISLTPLTAQNNVQIKVKVTESPPSVLSNVFKYLEIELQNIDNTNISDIIIEFKINKSWFNSGDYDPQKVVLQRYSGSKWNSIPPSKISETSDAYYYIVDLPGFSFFGITAEKNLAVPEAQTTAAPATPEAPTFGTQELEEAPEQMPAGEISETIATEVKGNSSYWYLLLIIPAMAIAVLVVYFTKFKKLDGDDHASKKHNKTVHHTKRGEMINHLVKQHKEGEMPSEDELVEARDHSRSNSN